jgi:hypothetical protein
MAFKLKPKGSGPHPGTALYGSPGSYPGIASAMPTFIRLNAPSGAEVGFGLYTLKSCYTNIVYEKSA